MKPEQVHRRQDGTGEKTEKMGGGSPLCLVASGHASQTHFTYTVPAAFPSPSLLLPEEVACSQAALPRATGQWPLSDPSPVLPPGIPELQDLAF